MEIKIIHYLTKKKAIIKKWRNKKKTQVRENEQMNVIYKSFLICIYIKCKKN